MILGLIFICTFLIPFMMIVTFKRLGMIESMGLNKQEDRKYPFLIVSIFFILTYYLLRQIEISSIFHNFALGGALLVVMAMFINYVFKISIHMMSVGGTLGGLIAMSIIYQVDIPLLIVCCSIVSGLVGTSRLILGVHRPVEVYSGFIMGVGVMMLLFFLVP